MTSFASATTPRPTAQVRGSSVSESSDTLIIAHFDTLIGSESGVERARALVLHLAMQGRLLLEAPLSPDDTPRTEGLSIPFGLPQGWEWRRVDQVGELKLGRQRSPKKHTGPNMRPYLRVANVFEGRIDTSDILEMNFDPAEAERFRLEPNDLLLNEGQSYELVGRPAIYRGEVPDACFQNTLIRLRPGKSILSEFALIVFRSYMRTGRFRKEAQQTTNIAHLSLGRLAAIEFPLPPLAEQKRIVAKVDQLMGLCDELEARQTKKRETGTRLTKSALEVLTTAETPEDFNRAWTHVSENFDDLLAHSTNATELRMLIRNLAVSGRLTRQLPADGDARVLLGQLREKRNPQRSPGILEEELTLSSSLPPSWCWAEFLDVASIDSNLVDPSDFPDAPHVAPDNIEKGTGRLLEYRTIREDGVTSNKHRFFPGQLLYSKIRPNLSKVVLVDFEGLCSADMYPLSSRIDRGYLQQFMLSRPFLDQVVREDNRLAMPKVNQEQLGRTIVALPPLAEQKRIVAKVAQLIALCDEFEERLTRSEDAASKWAAAIVAALSSPS